MAKSDLPEILRSKSRLHGWLTLMVVVCTVVLNAPVASAEASSGTWFFSLDNDVLAGSDDDYTNGLQVGWVSDYLDDYNEGPVPTLLADRLNGVPGLRGEGRQRFISYSLSHRLFTPTDTETTAPVSGDLPYSGLLFGTLTAGSQSDNDMHAFSLHVGMVGPSARGDEVQNEFHRLIGADPVNGWDNQIGDEALLNLNYEYRRRLGKFAVSDHVSGDVLLQTGGAVGNLTTMVTAGVGARIGWGVADDFMIPPQFFGEETIGSRPYTSRNRQESFWFFALLNTSAFGHAIFWDGNSGKPSPSVDYDPVIGRFYAGAVWLRGDMGITFSVANTTVPWQTPDDRSRQTYGRLGVSYSF